MSDTPKKYTASIAGLSPYPRDNPSSPGSNDLRRHTICAQSNIAPRRSSNLVANSPFGGASNYSFSGISPAATPRSLVQIDRERLFRCMDDNTSLCLDVLEKLLTNEPALVKDTMKQFPVFHELFGITKSSTPGISRDSSQKIGSPTNCLTSSPKNRSPKRKSTDPTEDQETPTVVEQQTETPTEESLEPPVEEATPAEEEPKRKRRERRSSQNSDLKNKWSKK